MIDALEVLHRAAVFQADQRAAMRAAVLERGEIAVFRAHDDDGHAADEGRAVVAGVGEFDLEAEEVPGRAFEDALLLGREHVLFGVDPVRYARQARRPVAGLLVRSVMASIGSLRYRYDLPGVAPLTHPCRSRMASLVSAERER